MDEIFKEFIDIYNHYYMYACFSSHNSSKLRANISKLANTIYELHKKVEELYELKFNSDYRKRLLSQRMKSIKSLEKKLFLFTGTNQFNQNLRKVLKNHN